MPNVNARPNLNPLGLFIPAIFDIPQNVSHTSTHQNPAHSLLPSTSILHKPLLIYHFAFPLSTPAFAIEAHLTANVTMHKVLCVSRGKAKFETEITIGDVVVIPAGVSHRLLEDLEGEFEMVGSYPKGCSWDMCYGKKGEEEKVERIKSVEWFERDME
ncbi:hypothetical protein V2W45_1470531 [Cenococcum geophilum]